MTDEPMQLTIDGREVPHKEVVEEIDSKDKPESVKRPRQLSSEWPYGETE